MQTQMQKDVQKIMEIVVATVVLGAVSVTAIGAFTLMAYQ